MQAWVQLVGPIPAKRYFRVTLGHHSGRNHVVMPPSAQLVTQAFSVQLLLSLHTPRARSNHHSKTSSWTSLSQAGASAVSRQLGCPMNTQPIWMCCCPQSSASWSPQTPVMTRSPRKVSKQPGRGGGDGGGGGGEVRG